MGYSAASLKAQRTKWNITLTTSLEKLKKPHFQDKQKEKRIKVLADGNLEIKTNQKASHKIDKEQEET